MQKWVQLIDVSFQLFRCVDQSTAALWLTSCSHSCAPVAMQYNLVPVRGWLCCVVGTQSQFIIYTHTRLTALFRTAQVSLYQKGKTDLDFTEARDSEWQWRHLGRKQVCTSLQTDNHTSIPPLSFLQAGCPSCRPTNSVKALKASTVHYNNLYSSTTQQTATDTHTHTRLTALCLGLPGWASTRKVKPIWILMKQAIASGSGISLGHMQVCTSLQTDNHASTSPLSFLQAGCPDCCSTNSVKAVKATDRQTKYN